MGGADICFSSELIGAVEGFQVLCSAVSPAPDDPSSIVPKHFKLEVQLLDLWVVINNFERSRQTPEVHLKWSLFLNLPTYPWVKNCDVMRYILGHSVCKVLTVGCLSVCGHVENKNKNPGIKNGSNTLHTLCLNVLFWQGLLVKPAFCAWSSHFSLSLSTHGVAFPTELNPTPEFL